MQFGTSGLRGLSIDLIERGASIYASAFGRYLLLSGRVRPGDPVLLGRDFRDSSPEIQAICTSALRLLGFKIFECGTVPTPALALYASKMKVASLMITGSHIPADRNGIKFYRPDGEISKADEAAITELAEKLHHPATVSADLRMYGEDHSDPCLRLFVERNTKLLKKGALAGLRVGVYQHSTAARDLVVQLLSHYGADVLALGRSETFIPVDTEAVSKGTVELLRAWSRSHGLDAIVSADGDGDRPLIADETGTPLRGDFIGLVAAQFLEAQTIVTPVTSNSGIETLGFSVVRTKVGSPFVIAGMQEALISGKDRVIGFEANGGVLTGSSFDVGGYRLDPLLTRDSVLPILAMLSLRSLHKRPLSAIVQAYGLPASVSDRLANYSAEAGSAFMGYLRGLPSNASTFLRGIGEVESVSDIDGLRIRLRDSRTIHFRPSGNAPEMRCYVEAATESAALDLLNAGMTRLKHWAETR